MSAPERKIVYRPRAWPGTSTPPDGAPVEVVRLTYYQRATWQEVFPGDTVLGAGFEQQYRVDVLQRDGTWLFVGRLTPEALKRHMLSDPQKYLATWEEALAVARGWTEIAQQRLTRQLHGLQSWAASLEGATPPALPQED